MRLLTLQCILVASDLAEGSAPAVRTAAELARLAEARLHLLHVAPEKRPGAEARLEEHARSVGGATGISGAQVAVGDPAAEIVARAASLEADVVVVGPHRRSGDDEGALGSTATRIIQTAPCPCLVAAHALALPLERVMVPTDLSDAARGALAVAVTWASALRRPGGESEVVALHVVADGGDPDPEESLRREVERARSGASEAARVRIRPMVARAADPAGEILRLCGAERVDLLVMGTSGLAGAASRFGSVSSAVARETTRPLLLVPPAVWRERAAE